VDRLFNAKSINYSTVNRGERQGQKKLQAVKSWEVGGSSVPGSTNQEKV